MADDNADGKYWFPKLCCKYIIFHWRTIFSIVWPLFSLVVFASGTDNQTRCMYVLLIMVGYWVTECIPIYMTSMLLPFLCPILKLGSSAVICVFYMRSQVLTLAAVLMFAIVFEHHGFHIRPALGFMLLLGCHPRILHLGLSMITMFLAMWLLNIFVVALMCPVVMAILTELETQGVMKVYEPPDPAEGPDAPLRPSNITLAYFFTIVFSTTIGGIGTTTGTSTFAAFKDDFHKKFPEGEKIEYYKWMLLCLPGMIAVGAFSCFSLQLTCMGLFQKTSKEYEICATGAEKKAATKSAVLIKYKELGRTFAEYVVAVLFSFILVFWLMGCPKTFGIWWKYGPGYIENSCIPYFILALMFLIPATWSCINYCNKDKNLRPSAPSPGILIWDAVQTRFPLGVYFLFSSVNALSKVIEFNDGIEILRYPIEGLKHLNPFLVGAFSSLIASVMTEILTNECVHTIVMKPLLDMAITMDVHPLKYAIPATICCNFGFLLPTAAPTYAIVLAYAKIPMIELIKHGLVIKIITWYLTIQFLNTYGVIFYDFYNAPSYLHPTTPITTTPSTTLKL